MPLSRAVATEGACSQDNTMISRLAHLPWFAGLPAELLTHIARHGTELSLADQQVLFLKGFPCAIPGPGAVRAGLPPVA